MRTTIDIPEQLLRRAKAEAALRGMKLKDYVAEALRMALVRGLGTVAEEAPDYAAPPQQELGPGCVLPLITGADGPALPDLTGERARELLDEEEVERTRRR